ncbi:MAG: ABC transporter substrate-binding protein [Rhodospirillaceae bacterium]|nr:ABC transporter substrate-binding protein [Rhodospirillaceae bacterium]
MKLGIIIAILAALCGTARAEGPPRRIVSMNLCTDQYVLLLAQREHIRSVSFLSADPNESPYAHLAAGLKINYGAAEEVIVENPDLVLTGQYTTGFAKTMLRKLGYRVVEVESPRDLAGTRKVMRIMGELLGASGKAEELIANMDRRLNAVGHARAGQPHQTALVYDANGFTVGRPSLADEVLTLVGLDNRAPRLGIKDFGQLALEGLLVAHPAYIVHLEYRSGVASLASQAIKHPAVTAMLAGHQPLSIPGRVLTCAGPSIADAAEHLAALLAGRES